MSFWHEGPSEKVKWILFAGIGFGLPLLIVGPLFGLAYRASNTTMEKRFGSICLSRLNTIGKAFELYAADNDGALPPAARWTDATWPYVLKKDPAELTEHAYQCPSIAKLRSGEYGYAMNEELGGRKSDAGTVPLVFDADLLGRNAHGSLEHLALPPRHKEHTENNALLSNLTARPIRTGG